MENPNLAQIILRAYELWEQAGRPQDKDDGFYCRAEEELKIEGKFDPLRSRTIYNR